MERQSVRWKAAKLYAEHEKRKISTGSAAVPVPRLFMKKTLKNKKYRELSPFKARRKLEMQTVQFKEKRKDENLRHRSKRNAELQKIKTVQPVTSSPPSSLPPPTATTPSPSPISPFDPLTPVGFIDRPLSIDDLKSEVNIVCQSNVHFCTSRIRTQFPNGNGKLACTAQEHGCKLSIIFKRDSVDRHLVTVTSWVSGTCVTPLTGASVPLPKPTREPKAFASVFLKPLLILAMFYRTLYRVIVPPNAKISKGCFCSWISIASRVLRRPRWNSDCAYRAFLEKLLCTFGAYRQSGGLTALGCAFAYPDVQEILRSVGAKE